MDKQSKQLLKNALNKVSHVKDAGTLSRTLLGGLGGAAGGAGAYALLNHLTDKDPASGAARGALLGGPLAAITAAMYEPNVTKAERVKQLIEEGEWDDLPIDRNYPVIVDKGVREGRGVRKMTLGPKGELIAYSNEHGDLDDAGVWSYDEILKTSSLDKQSYIEKQKGTNSEGEETEWVIKSHETDEVIGHYKTKEDAEEALQAMHANS